MGEVNQFTSNLVSNGERATKVRQRPSRDYNLAIRMLSKKHGGWCFAGQFIDQGKRGMEEESLQAHQPAFVPLSTIIRQITKNAFDKRYLASKDSYLAVSDLVKFSSSSDLYLITSGIISHIFPSTSGCGKGCLSIVLHPIGEQTGILVFFKSLGHSLKIGQRVVIINPLILLATACMLQYDKEMLSLTSPLLNIAFYLKDASRSLVPTNHIEKLSFCASQIPCIVPLLNSSDHLYCIVHRTECLSKKMVKIRPDLAAGHSALHAPASKTLQKHISRFAFSRIAKELQFIFYLSLGNEKSISISIEDPCIHHQNQLYKQAGNGDDKAKAATQENEPSNIKSSKASATSEAILKKKAIIHDAVSKSKSEPLLGRGWDA